MGVSVREKRKGSGVWWIFITHNGKRRSKKIGRDKRIAFEAAQTIEAKINAGDWSLIEKEPEEVKTFGDYASMWITTTVPATCKPSTGSDYKGILKNHILPAFGKTPIKDINKLMVKNFLMGKVNKGFAASTVTHIKNALSGILNLAMDDETIPINPAHGLGKVIRSKGLKIDIDPLTSEELSLLLSMFQKHFPRHYPMALTLARTGMRLGEAIGLQWGDVDFIGRFITIQRNIVRGRIGTPKNDKVRRVDMSEQLTEELLILKTRRKAETLKKRMA